MWVIGRFRKNGVIIEADEKQQIRGADEQVEVAIMTTSEDFALDAYRLHVMRYIEKPVKTSDVRDVLTIVQQQK